MNQTEISPSVLHQVSTLQEEYAQHGQNLANYLEKLHYEQYLKYWDYIQLDVLLGLTLPRTTLPDEKVFIIYHQIAELYFRLILLEFEQVMDAEPVGSDVFLDKLKRINRYYNVLIASSEISTECISPAQFQKFRTSLFPASGFQSVQYRLIEIGATDLRNLVAVGQRDEIPAKESTKTTIEKLYWKQGGIDPVTGRKNLTLIHFEEKYNKLLIKKARQMKHKNLWQLFDRYYRHTDQTGAIVDNLKKFDQAANVHWPLAHYRNATRHLVKDNEPLTATGNTSWKKYLMPKNQKIIFFPELWSEECKANWGIHKE